MFKNFFGKKKDGFYLQVEDDNVAPKPEAKPAKAPAKAPESVTTTAPVAVTQTETTTAPIAQTEAKADPKAAKADKKAAKADKKSAKKAEPPKDAPAPAPVATAYVAPTPVAPATTTFAPDYLIKPSSISSRRLPGANMSAFLDMARQAKKPVNIK